MPRLKDKQRQVPGGFMFELGSLGWKSAPFASFNVIVDQVFTVINANRSIAQSRGWPLDRPRIEAWVDAVNAERCQQNGWNDYITPDAPEEGLPDTSDQWPLWARAISKFRKEGERGVGDTIKRVIGNNNSEAFKKWYKETFNRDCGCCARQEHLNKFKY